MNNRDRCRDDRACHAQELSLGFGMVVQEIGGGVDVDEEFRRIASEVVGTRPVGENDRGRVDVVPLWWRTGDGNLVGALRGVMTILPAGRFLWLLTPKRDRPGHVPPGEIDEEADHIGFHGVTAAAPGRGAPDCLADIPAVPAAPARWPAPAGAAPPTAPHPGRRAG
ncbi:DUF3052 family protein (plasmid) [Rhodococcus opacus]|uniref:DUF3052 family protein n=1 Tax=Rhodococcus opacus TaxID=37919 RepID=UPI0003091B21|nr:DUF3052 family protein [Rhodococcus opacus]MDV6245184.1 DUF3052 family protein [Rhodococcus opacus]WKN60141.1 DUF3052 family protein [Rhodococcus opacus]